MDFELSLCMLMIFFFFFRKVHLGINGKMPKGYNEFLQCITTLTSTQPECHVSKALMKVVPRRGVETAILVEHISTLFFLQRS